MNQNQNVFKIFFKENIGSPENYIGSANVIATNINEALEIGQTYGLVTSIHREDGCVITSRKEQTAVGAAEEQVTQ